MRKDYTQKHTQAETRQKRYTKRGGETETSKSLFPKDRSAENGELSKEKTGIGVVSY